MVAIGNNNNVQLINDNIILLTLKKKCSSTWTNNIYFNK